MRIELGLMVVIVGCGGQTLDVGRDPARGGAGPTSGGSAGYVAAGSGVRPDGVAGSGVDPEAGGAGADVKEDSGGFSAGGTGGGTTARGGASGTGGGTTARGGASAAGGVRNTTADAANWPTVPACDTDDAVKSLIGVWEGDVEDFYLQPVQHVRVEITGATDHSLCGTVTWGTSPPPPAPTDPDKPYPSAEAFPIQLGSGGSPGQSQQPVEGFAYTIRQGAARDGTVRFSTWKNEPWRAWCGIQPVFPVEGEYACSPTYQWGTTGDHPDVCNATFPDGSTAPYSLIRCLCNQLCLCDADGCTSRPQDPRQFDLTLNAMGDVLTGPFTGAYLEHPDWAYRLVHAQ